MLVSFLPSHSWQGHLEVIWELEADDGVKVSALFALESRARRRRPRPISELAL
jgi:hypothetical protein